MGIHGWIARNGSGVICSPSFSDLAIKKCITESADSISRLKGTQDEAGVSFRARDNNDDVGDDDEELMMMMMILTTMILIFYYRFIG